MQMTDVQTECLIFHLWVLIVRKKSLKYVTTCILVQVFSVELCLKKIIIDILSNYFAKRGNRLLTAKRNFTRHHIYIYVKKAAKMKKKKKQCKK